MNKLFRKLAPLILLAGAVLFVLIGINEVKAQKTYISAQGVITSITEEPAADNDGYEYTVMVKYTAEGKEYESELGSYSASMKVGDAVEVLYNPDKPSEIVKKGYFAVVMLFGVAALAVISAVALVIRRLNGR